MKKPCEIGNNALKAKKTSANYHQFSTNTPKKNQRFFLPFETCVTSGSKSGKVVSL